MDNFDNLSVSEKAEATELQRMIAIEQQKAQFQAQVCMGANRLFNKMLVHGSHHACLIFFIYSFIYFFLFLLNHNSKAMS
uniref:Uncharacterized protein n=1 Tax=Stegastes partitus TaxID=144197 RepID=A0A3B5AXG4_9TELE